METIKSDIQKRFIQNETIRYGRLCEIKAPSVILDNILMQIEDAKNDVLAISDKENLLMLEFTSRELKTGQGGKQYVQYQTADCVVNYFPNGRFGRFITKNNYKS